MKESNPSTLNEWYQMILSEPSYLMAIAIGGAILILLIALNVKGNNKKAILKKHAPNFVFEAFQLAPLGRDAYFKIKNIGEPAFVNFVGIKQRDDIKITNANTTNFEVTTDKIYGIFCEIQGNQKIKADFEVEIDFKDRLGNQYRQVFAVDEALNKGKVKLINYA
ncbi:MAG: hypothetical protein AB8G15_04830 [Saprospiraceae bacterium]